MQKSQGVKFDDDTLVYLFPSQILSNLFSRCFTSYESYLNYIDSHKNEHTQESNEKIPLIVSDYDDMIDQTVFDIFLKYDDVTLDCYLSDNDAIRHSIYSIKGLIVLTKFIGFSERFLNLYQHFINIFKQYEYPPFTFDGGRTIKLKKLQYLKTLITKIEKCFDLPNSISSFKTTQ
ncbi:hypothetical protein RF11_01282 [Thelohanellus kitauei]|uniref:Uncharacterized protein n=1 Tax=Thelohanellus kitauei TaxID=669202 RepID=A0A0C2JN98_THEKT|nr:hypothetical protein RF11_01282 [Thelohanellus kitauei]